MTTKTLSTIYFYLVSFVGLILLVIGIFHSINFFINSTQYDEYPMKYTTYDNCDTIQPPYVIGTVQNQKMPAPVINPEEKNNYDRQRQQCKDRIKADRKQHKVEDMRNALSFTLIGLVLFAIHFPIARRQTN